MQMILCKSFPAFTPFTLRRERAVDVFRLINRFNLYAQKENATHQDATTPTAQSKPKVIRRPAPDTWF